MNVRVNKLYRCNPALFTEGPIKAAGTRYRNTGQFPTGKKHPILGRATGGKR